MALGGFSTRKSRLPVVSLIVLALAIIAAVGANWLAPHDPIHGELGLRNLPPFWLEGGSTDFLLGTDQLGRDLLSRLLFGARYSLSLSLIACVLGMAMGSILGLLSGWFGGWVDEVVMRLVDIFLSVPIVLVALVFVVVTGPSFGLMIGILITFLWIRFARIVRGETLRLRSLDHVMLARVSGASTARILRVHILPGIRNTLVVVATLQLGVLILLESTLSFLGAGIPPPTPSWGSMIADGRGHLASAWWISTIPGIAILLTLLAFNLVGEWMRDALDPRLR